MSMVELIRRKRDGGMLSDAEIISFVRGVTDGTIPDYQAAALLMAIYFQSLDERELAALTDAMLRSGDVIDLSDLPGVKIDKHSTGGVGDKISLALAPAVAACGIRVPMICGRGLGHTGGTLDKLEAIPGFDVSLTPSRFRHVLRECGLVISGPTDRLAPADKRLYALRDVTGTVESIPLIAASILAKKLAEGIDGLVIDVKVGSGAFMKTHERARALAATLLEIGRRAGKRVTALITDMNQPLGRYVGNAAEVHEALAVLAGHGEPDLVELTLALGAEMLLLGGIAGDVDDGRRRIARVLGDGSAMARWRRCSELQGGDLARLPPPEVPIDVQYDGAAPTYVQAIDAGIVGAAAVALGAGRARKEDTIDPRATIHVLKKVGEPVKPHEPFVAFSTPQSGDREAVRRDMQERLRAAYTFGATPPLASPLILEVIR
jgi:pyrimidine-nucleoside phosphorylase/thymidine phosphorylase